MIGAMLNHVGRFWGFPAGSLSRLRFLPNLVPRSMISRGFSTHRGAPKNFPPDFSRAAGNGRGDAAPSPQRRGDVAAVDGGDVGGGFERERMVQEGLRDI